MTQCNSCGQPVDEGLKFCGNCGHPMGEDGAVAKAGLNSLLGQTLLGQYVMEKKLGEGGMGTVYLADQPSMDRKAVVKVLHPHLTSDAKWVERFNREAKIASKLSHPNSITLYNYGKTDEGYIYIAMEYVDGDSLAAIIEQTSPMPLDRVALIAQQVCGAMQEAHDLHIIHRDLKPDNVLLSQRNGKDWAKVLDFGIAKMKGQAADDMQLTATGMVFGTPAYMSPEQFSGEELDSRSDLYSVAVMVYEMLAGKRPFNASTPIGYFKLHLEEPPPAMATANPRAQIPGAVEAVVRKALAKKPADRHQRAEDFADALREAIRTGRAAGSVAAPDRARSDNIRLEVGDGPALELETAGSGLSFLERLEAGQLSAEDIAPATAPPAWRPADEPGTSTIIDKPEPDGGRSAAARAVAPLPGPPGLPQMRQPSAGPPPGPHAAAPPNDHRLLELAFDPRAAGPPPTGPPPPGTSTRGRSAVAPPATRPAPPRQEASLSTIGAGYPGASNLRTPTGDLSWEIQRARGGRAAAPARRGGGLLLLLVLAAAAAGVGYVLKVRPGASKPSGGDGDAGASPPAGAVSGAIGGPAGEAGPAARRMAGGAQPREVRETPAAAARVQAIPPGMIRVPPGQYRVGGDPDGVAPTRVVQLDPYYIDRDEVTNERYSGCVADGRCAGSKLEKDRRFNGARQPVLGVRFADAVAFCAWDGGKRLPTADEWEAAARGSEATLFPWGDAFNGNRANVAGREDGHPQTAPVGSFASGNTLLGVRDMAGNAAEWTAESGENGYVRGGSYQVPPDRTASSLLHKARTEKKADKSVGFRCARSDV